MLTTGAGDHPDHGAQQVDRVGVAPALVVVGEERADVADAGGAEQRVDHGVGEDVSVGVALEAALVLDLDPAEDQPAAGGEAVAVVADPDRSARLGSSERLRAAPAAAGGPRRRRSRRPRGASRNSTRAVVPEADLLGQVGVGGEREDGAGLDAHLGEAARRIELADRLAQARGRDLDGDAALGDRLDRGLVEVRAGRARAAAARAPDLDQIGVGEDVEEAGAGASASASK